MTVAFSLSGVAKHYPEFSLRDINLDLPAGEVMGLVGVNGAGKTTLLRLLSGLAAADAGEVTVLGHRLPEAQVEAKRDMGFASEDMRLYRSQTLRWHMDLIRAIYPDWDSAYADHLLRRFDLRVDQRLGGYSHGQRVKAMLLLSLARRPRLLLLDEPTTGLDPVARAEVLEALSDVLRDAARSVLFSSHNTQDVEQLADTITFLHAGRMIASSDKERFLDSWRRVSCEGHAPEGLSDWPEVAMVRHSGSLIEIKTRAWDAQFPARLDEAGLKVQRVDRMALEDIFVTAVRSGGAA
ncbi:ATP-binding cassette domain-containing protein [Pseudomarimonas salicorniae]|uniref:ABC transporter ATP-binding protein n=1 Tax=Pseudomarimonas salicorniae TaxID=2933270 RepID=A0ABT0GMX6_9GAMM|nr:ABC transporter ATP-binding protein [Lysobacter sp. CAU 1642]MCK7595350.1 ABC transporter ATP-binding protein [Lysobacter sp. CAU 1642]